MKSKTHWWMLAVTVLATAVATGAALEYLHRHPDSWLRRWLGRTESANTPTANPALRLGIAGMPAAGTPASEPIEPSSPTSLPPDILDQSLRELRLLDQIASSPVVTAEPAPHQLHSDEFCLEKIPVPPRCLAAEPSEGCVVIPDGRTLVPVTSVETVPVAPKPVPETETPQDLDTDTAGPTESTNDPDDLEESPHSFGPTGANPCASGRAVNRPAGGSSPPVVRGACNTPCSVDVEIVQRAKNSGASLDYLTGAAVGFNPELRDEPATNGCVCGRHRCNEPANCASQSDQDKSAAAQSNTVQTDRPCTRLAHPKLIRRVYPVADLLESPEDGTALENLVAEVLESECPYTRQGLVRYYNGAHCLIVVETAETHEKIVAFLNELRRAARAADATTGAVRRGQEVLPAGHVVIPSRASEAERVLVLPVLRPVLVPVAVPVPVGAPDLQLPPPQFRIPDNGCDEEDCPECPAHRFHPPTTPEQLPDCQAVPSGIVPALKRFWDQFRGVAPNGASDQVQIFPDHRCPETLPVFPPDYGDSDEDTCPPEEEDSEPLETDLFPPIG